MKNEDKIREARSIIWYNLPDHVPVTMGICRIHPNESARGGGLCLKCGQDMLAREIGQHAAQGYVWAVENIRRLEREQLED